MKKILVLESDGAVVEALANEFAVYGCMVEAVDDAEAARQKATSDKFVMVVISTTLAKSHGFLAFTFLKRLQDLEGVPFVIMYNDTEVDQIASHQNRPTHADVYIQKPFDFNDLLVQVSEYLGIEGAPAAGEGTEEIILDDAVVVDDGEAPAGSRASVPEIPEDELAVLDTPTDDGTFEEPAPAPPPPPKKGKGKSKAAAAEPPPETPKTDAVTERALARAEEKIEALENELSGLRGKAEDAKTRASKAEEEKRSIEGELDTLKIKVEDLQKALSEKGSASVSTRELLDLRELINRKDKEILNLKDSLNGKEKELLEEKDRVVAQMRITADFEDKLKSTEQELAGIEKTLAAVSKDKEAASKRAEDHKAHWESSKQDVSRLQGELEEARKLHELEIEDTKSKLAADGVALKDRALAEQKSHLDAEKDSEIGSLKISHERSLGEMKDQYEAEIAGIRDKFEGDLKELERKDAADKKEAVEALRAELDGKAAEAAAKASEHEQELKEQVREKEQINKALMKETAGQEKQIVELQAKVKDLEERCVEMGEKVKDLTADKEKLVAETATLGGQSDELRNSLAAEKGKRAEAESHIRRTDELLADVTDNMRNLVQTMDSRDKY